MDKLVATAQALAATGPEYFSVTFGAGGSTRERTLEAVQLLRANGHDTAPHLSCIGSTRDNIRAVLNTYRERGIKRIVALRGDLPSGMAVTGEFHYANELVEFIRAETGDHFHIEVACYPEFHPQAKTPRDDMLNFRRKMEAGANSALTQYFYNPDAYFRFVEQARAAGVRQPIVPCIMPILNSQLARISEKCGAEIPRWICRTLESYGGDIEAGAALGRGGGARLARGGRRAGGGDPRLGPPGLSSRGAAR